MWSITNRIIFFAVSISALRMLIGAISAVFLLSRGVNVIDIGFLKTFQAGVIFLVDIPLSYLADKKSRKFTVLVATLLASIWLLITGISHSFWLFLIAEFFNALSVAMLGGSLDAYLIDTNNIDQKHPIKILLAKLHKYSLFMMAVAAFIGANFFTMQTGSVWIVASLCILALFIVGVFILPADQRNSNENNEPETFSELWRDTKTILHNIKNNGDLRLIIIALLVSQLFFQNIIQFWQVILNFVPNNMVDNGSIYGYVFVAILLMQSLASYLVEKLPTKLIYGILFGTLIIVSSLFIFGTTIATVVIFILTLFFGFKMLSILLNAALQTQLTANLRATYSSVISTAIRLLLLVVMPAFAYLIVEYHFLPVWLFYIILILTFFLNEKDRKPSSP